MDFRSFQQRFQKKKPVHFPNEVSQQPLVSVCVQTFQHEGYISECLDSILMQKTDFDIEILVGEDKSIDSTREICIRYAEQYSDKIRLFLHHNENKISVNGITTGNFNAFYNFFQAKGKYIAFCEGDDYWTDPYKLKRQVEFLKANREYSLCYHSYEVLQDRDIPHSEIIEQPASDISGENLQLLKIHPLLSTICFRNSLYYLPSQVLEVINVDSFLLSLLGSSGQGKFISKIKPSIYRKHQGGIWAGRFKAKKFLSKIITYSKLNEYYSQQKNSTLAVYFNKEVKNTYKMLFHYLIKNGQIYKAVKLAPEILKYLLSNQKA